MLSTCLSSAVWLLIDMTFGLDSTRVLPNSSSNRIVAAMLLLEPVSGDRVIVSPPVTAPAEAAAAVKAAPAPISDAMAKPPVVASRCRSTPA